MSFPESVSLPVHRAELMQTLERFDNGVTVEDVLGKESDYDHSKHTQSVLVQVLLEIMCHSFVENESQRERLVREIYRLLSIRKVVNDQLYADRNNRVKIEIKKKVFLFMKEMWKKICPNVQGDESALKYFESEHLSANIDCYYLNNFKQLEVVGKGGFGIVYKVKSKEDEEIYAVKKIFFDYKNDARYIKVMREAKNLSTLNHPNTVNYKHSWIEIIPNGNSSNSLVGSSSDHSSDNFESGSSVDPKHLVLTDISDEEDEHSSSILFVETGSIDGLKSLPSDFEDSTTPTEIDTTVSTSEEEDEFSSISNLRGTLYIQMEFCDCDLSLWLEKRATGEELPFEMSIFDMFKHILSGIHYIHAKDIIHRDLKPHNIFYSRAENILKIGDFGLATLPHIPTTLHVTKVAQSTVHSSAVGTVPYAAPEQMQSNNYSTKVDMFSLGIILIELMNTCRTISELVEIIRDVKKGEITEEMKKFPILGNLVKNLINENPEERKSATDVVKMMMDEIKRSIEREKMMERKFKTMEETIKNLTDHIAELTQK